MHHDSAVFSKQQLHDILVVKSVEVDVQTAIRVGECHLKQRGDKTARRDIVHCKHLAFVDKRLNSGKCLCEIFSGVDARHVAAHTAEHLRERRATERKRRIAEINVDKSGVLLVLNHWRHNLAHVRHLSGSRDNHRAWSHHLFLAVFLRHRETVLASRDVDAKTAGKVAACLHGAV